MAIWLQHASPFPVLLLAIAAYYFGWSPFGNTYVLKRGRQMCQMSLVCYVHRIGRKGANKRAIIEVLPEAYWQRCYVHFLRRFAEDESFDSTSSRVT